jgi:hypothetical protein
MLDFLVALGETRDAGVAQDVTARARAAVEKVRVCCFVGCGWDHCWYCSHDWSACQTLTTDKALQQTLIEDAIKSLTTGERVEATVPALIEKTFNQTWWV